MTSRVPISFIQDKPANVSKLETVCVLNMVEKSGCGGLGKATVALQFWGHCPLHPFDQRLTEAGDLPSRCGHQDIDAFPYPCFFRFFLLSTHDMSRYNVHKRLQKGLNDTITL